VAGERTPIARSDTESREQDTRYRLLGPGSFPPLAGKYEWERPGARISIDREHASFPVADPSDPSHRLFLDAALAPARANPSIDDGLLVDLEQALVAVSRITPDALGLAGSASWSGPGATGWEKTIAHPHHGPGFAAEIIVAAALIGHTWPAGNDLDVALTIQPGDRIDFGIKFRGDANRRTVEADVLIQSPDGTRAVDVKHARDGRYRSHLTTAHAGAIAAVLRRGEVETFHFVTDGRFSRGYAAAIEQVNSLLMPGARRVFWHAAAGRDC
jgi:hypothetical protein